MTIGSGDERDITGVPWGSAVVSFEARDEPARSAFLRLVRREQGNANHLAGSEPGGYRWSMKCQPGESSCFINLARTPEKP
jgi:hypothetical protein